MKTMYIKITNLNYLLICLFGLMLFSCTQNKDKSEPMSDSPLTVNQVLSNNRDRVLIIAHRGDWRNAPENSLQAIQNCIDMDIDMVEIDVRLTKDSIPVLMHDKTINRTTTGKGNVSDWTLKDLQSLHLRNGANHVTRHKIPTLEEALNMSKNKILLNLDKCYKYFDVIYPILEKTKTTQQVLMKGKVSSEKVKQDLGLYLPKISFMPIINLDNNDASDLVFDYLNGPNPPLAIEFVFSDLKSPIINEFASIHKKGTRVWVNSLWASLNAGYEDDIAVQHADSIYGWYIKKKVSMIQTDRPQLLLDYLQSVDQH